MKNMYGTKRMDLPRESSYHHKISQLRSDSEFKNYTLRIKLNYKNLINKTVNMSDKLCKIYIDKHYF